MGMIAVDRACMIKAFLKCNEVLTELSDNQSRLRAILAAQILIGLAFTPRTLMEAARKAGLLTLEREASS